MFNLIRYTHVHYPVCTCTTDMKILAIVGEKVAPIAVPCTWRKVNPANSN